MKSVGCVASVLACCAGGCVNLHLDPPPSALLLTEIYQRATNQFAQAAFFKPAELATNDLVFRLAPLILQEVDGGGTPLPLPDRFGALSLSNGLPALDPSRPSIYWHADTVTLGGKAHTQLAYMWFYSLDRAEPKLPAQGIRVTLNSVGQPVIWEVLADNSGGELIFVAQSLEAAAARFGKALPGRRYAVERSPEEAPNVIVARVIDDGPVAMGPIVYLSAGTRRVSTLICRCMPAQVKTLRTTATYDLLSLQAMPTNPLLPQLSGSARMRPAFWPGDASTSNRLERCLRLPLF